MQEQNILVFVEVRYRRNSDFGNGIETIDFTKQTRLIKTAEYYLQYFPQFAMFSYRFDVFAVSRTTKPKPCFHRLNTSQRYIAQVEWVKNAFSG